MKYLDFPDINTFIKRLKQEEIKEVSVIMQHQTRASEQGTQSLPFTSFWVTATVTKPGWDYILRHKAGVGSNITHLKEVMKELQEETSKVFDDFKNKFSKAGLNVIEAVWNTE